MSAWLHIVGIGEDGLEGLLPAARAVVQSAEVIIGGDRHHQLAGITSAERLSWPSAREAWSNCRAHAHRNMGDSAYAPHGA